jgi:hypothetical protein
VAAVCIFRRRLGEAVPFPAGAAHIIKQGDIPLSDSEDGEGRQPARSQPARHPDEELEAEQAAAEQQQHSDDWEPDAAAADSDEEGLAAAAAALRLSPPPVSAAELASGELEVVSAEEDRRMIELMRQQVCGGGGGWQSWPAGAPFLSCIVAGGSCPLLRLQTKFAE